MSLQALYSTAQQPSEIACALRAQTTLTDIRAVIYFASASLDTGALAVEMQASFGDAPVFGCTTAGEIVSGQMLSHGVVAMVLGGDILADLGVALIPGLSALDTAMPAVRTAFAALEQQLGAPLADLNLRETVGIVLVDGLSGAEERLMDAIGNLTDITFVGGSAGDDLAFKQTLVFADGRAHPDAALVALLRLPRGFDIIKTQSFCPLGKTLTATRVNEAERRVMAFDGQPASAAYAAALGCSESEAAARFMRNPVGLMVGNEPYIRSPRQFEDQDLLFYCQIKPGMELEVMAATDIIGDTRQAVTAKVAELGGVSGLIDFHCILRTLELRQKNLCAEYGAIFAEIPTIGFSTYDEEYIGHVNQTSTMLVLK